MSGKRAASTPHSWQRKSVGVRVESAGEMKEGVHLVCASHRHSPPRGVEVCGAHHQNSTRGEREGERQTYTGAYMEKCQCGLTRQDSSRRRLRVHWGEKSTCLSTWWGLRETLVYFAGVPRPPDDAVQVPALHQRGAGAQGQEQLAPVVDYTSHTHTLSWSLFLSGRHLNVLETWRERVPLKNRQTDRGRSER